MKVIRNIIVGAIGILVCNRILAPFDIFIGIKARNSEEAYAKLARMVDTSEGFILYDTYGA